MHMFIPKDLEKYIFFYFYVQYFEIEKLIKSVCENGVLQEIMAGECLYKPKHFSK